VFTLGLLDKLKESQPSRIVVLSSIGHESPAGLGGIDFDTLNDPTKTSARTRYGRSKLANILFTKALARRLANERVYVNAAHPGYVSTELIRHTGDEFGSLMGTVTEKVTRMVAMSPKVGALTELYVATSPEIENNDVRGRYFIPIANEIQPSKYHFVFSVLWIV
jgi:NAD(P)-dependent dehydrogenase (short-subunit alcohol dehydrogenase family)